MELRRRGDSDSQLAQCAARRQAPSSQRARVPATTVAASDAGDGGSATTTRSEGSAAATKEAGSAFESPTRGVRNLCCGCCGCAGADGTPALVVVEWRLLLLTSSCCKCCGERRRSERARTCVGCWQSDSELAGGGMGPTQECTNRPEAPRRSYARATTGSVRSVRTAAWRGAWWLSASAGGGGVIRNGVAADLWACRSGGRGRKMRSCGSVRARGQMRAVVRRDADARKMGHLRLSLLLTLTPCRSCRCRC